MSRGKKYFVKSLKKRTKNSHKPKASTNLLFAFSAPVCVFYTHTSRKKKIPTHQKTHQQIYFDRQFFLSASSDQNYRMV